MTMMMATTPLRCSFVCILLLLASTRCFSQPLEKPEKPFLDPVTYLPDVTHKVFLDVYVENSGESGRIELGLFGNLAPKAVENFRSLCACDKGIGSRTGVPLCYRDSTFHRVVTDFLIQGGDFSHHDGTGGESIFEERFFEDESFAVKHNRPHLLSMANSSRKNTNGSQFFINTNPCMWLDGKNVVFGVVLDGKSIIESIAKEGTYVGKPKSKITIVDSGELPVEPKDKRKIPVAASPRVYF